MAVEYDQLWYYPNTNGQPATNQRAIVFGPGTEEDNNNLALIYTDATLTTQLPNPTVTDPVTGYLNFWVPTPDPGDPSFYSIHVGPTNNGASQDWNAGADSGNPVLTVNFQPPDGGGNVNVTAVGISAIPNAIMAAKGDILTATANDTPAILPAGAPGLFLTTNPAEPTGLEWVAGGGGGGVDDVNGETGSVDIFAAPISAVPSSRILTAGTGLSGGGDLSADRTFDVDYGTTAGTAAQGNDARITGAIQSTIMAAKGDLLGASANDTPVVVPAGTNGQFLRANSGATPGVDWFTVTASTVGADPAGSAAAAQAAAIAASLQKAANLSDLTNVPSARTALGLGGAAQLNVGTTAGTVAAGDDSRIVGAVQSALADTKGDILVASAPDTVTALPAGPDGQVLRTNSATGTGLEWDTLTASDVGAVPTSRQVLTQNGLTGGGDLSADRTIEPVYGTTANTVAEGDDARIVGAIQGAVFNAKADLLTATADNTPAILPASGGSDGDVLTLNSGELTGLEWVTPTGGGISPTIFDAKGDILAASAADTPAIRSVGTDGQFLRADSGQTSGLVWDTATASDVGAIATTIVNAKGDLVTATADDTPAILTAGTDGFFLSANSGQSTGLEWVAAPASGIPATIFDAKGDLVAASAADTAARLAVGANGLELTPDSTLSTGLKWALSKSSGQYPRSTGFVTAGGIVTARSSKAAVLNALFFIPFVTLIDATLSVITWEATGNVATAVVRLGIYGADSAGLPSGAAVADYGQTASDTTGVKTAAVSTALGAGLWYLAFVGQVAAPTVRHCAGFSPFVASTTFPSGTGLGWNNAWVQTGVSGTLPTVGSISDTDSPLCGLKF